MSQTAEILNYLKQGKTLTPLEALRKFGTMRLAARIKDIRDRGESVDCHICEVKTSRGTISRVAKYKLARA